MSQDFAAIIGKEMFYFCWGLKLRELKCAITRGYYEKETYPRVKSTQKKAEKEMISGAMV